MDQMAGERYGVCTLSVGRNLTQATAPAPSVYSPFLSTDLVPDGNIANSDNNETLSQNESVLGSRNPSYTTELNHSAVQLRQVTEFTQLGGGAVYDEGEYVRLDQPYPSSVARYQAPLESITTNLTREASTALFYAHSRVVQPSNCPHPRMHPRVSPSYPHHSISPFLSSLPTPERNFDDPRYGAGHPMPGTAEETRRTRTDDFRAAGSSNGPHPHSYAAHHSHYVISPHPHNEPHEEGQPGPGPRTLENRDRRERQRRGASASKQKTRSKPYP